ncbi:hypothetical protein BM534_21790, partial [Clostridioides difficile]
FFKIIILYGLVSKLVTCLEVHNIEHPITKVTCFLLHRFYISNYTIYNSNYTIYNLNFYDSFAGIDISIANSLSSEFTFMLPL